jgi:pimeloyl-ACP methyl ester carboxylesterase
MKKTAVILILLFISGLVSATAQHPSFSVAVTGKGRPVLLFPGFTCTGEVWGQTVAMLSKDHECHAFTFAGFGGVAPIEKPWLPKIKEEVVAYVKKLKLKNPTVIGHSLGGTLGLWIASTETHLFGKIIVVDALPCTGALMMPDFKAENMVYDNPYSKQLLEMDTAAFKSMAQQQVSYMCLNKEKHVQLTDWIVQADRKTYVYGYIDLLRLDLREDIAKIKIPVLILAATHPDRKTIENTYDTQYRKLPGRKILYADNAAHFVMYDQPEWFLEKIRQNVN